MASLIVALLALVGAQAQTPPARPPAHLKVMIPLDSLAPYDHALTEAVREFNAAHSGTQVELVKSGGSFQGLRAIIAANYANDLPDIALVNDADIPTLADLKIVQSLPAGWVASKKLMPSLGATKCHGQVCALPFQRRVPVWFFNRELLFKLNQDTDHIPTQWSKLGALGHKLRKQGELWGVAIPETGEAGLVRWSALGFPASMAPEATADWVLKLWDGPPLGMPGNISAEEATRMFLEQRAVILLGTLDQLTFLKTNASFRIGSALPDGELAWYGTDFVILGKGNQEAAREFLDYLYKPDVALTMFKASSTLPVTRAQNDSPLWKKEIEAWPVLRTAMARRLKPLNLERVAPPAREDWATTIWEAVELSPPPAQRAAKAAELKDHLQKRLSTNPH